MMLEIYTVAAGLGGFGNLGVRLGNVRKASEWSALWGIGSGS